jgi:hypothetical protein
MRGKALPYAGFAKLRPGRIHVFCPACKRKMSNMPRTEAFNGLVPDPPNAVLVHIWCDCTQGGKEDFGGFLDAYGRWLCSYCGLHNCDNNGGRRRCDERLMPSWD